MTIKITKANRGIRQKVEQMADVDLNICYQCKKCSCGCPVSNLVKSPPSEVIRYLQLNDDEEIFNTDLIWTCASCSTCHARCPMGINMASIIDALRALSIETEAEIQEGNVPLFNKAFLKTVSLFGRTYELGLLAAYKIGTQTYFKDAEKFPMMMKKGKIAILPPRPKGRKIVKPIFKKIRTNNKPDTQTDKRK